MTPVLIENYDRFCSLLDEQVELQETLVSVCLAQLQMGIEGNILKLNEKTSAIAFLIEQISNIDMKIKEEMTSILMSTGSKKRLCKLKEFVDNFLPEPWKQRAKESLDRLRVSLLYLKEWSKEASNFYRSALKTRREILRAISPESALSPLGYSESGECADVVGFAKFMDRKG